MFKWWASKTNKQSMISKHSQWEFNETIGYLLKKYTVHYC